MNDCAPCKFTARILSGIRCNSQLLKIPRKHFLEILKTTVIQVTTTPHPSCLCIFLRLFVCANGANLLFALDSCEAARRLASAMTDLIVVVLTMVNAGFNFVLSISGCIMPELRRRAILCVHTTVNRVNTFIRRPRPFLALLHTKLRLPQSLHIE